MTTACPHCKHKSPAIKKDGYTKLFVKPLQNSSVRVAKQAKNIKKREAEDLEVEENKFEVITSVSETTATKSERKSSNADTNVTSRKGSHVETEHGEGDYTSEEELIEGGAQKYITPIEVRDQLRKMWKKEECLLGLIYGKYDPSQPLHFDSLGFK